VDFLLTWFTLCYLRIIHLSKYFFILHTHTHTQHIHVGVEGVTTVPLGIHHTTEDNATSRRETMSSSSSCRNSPSRQLALLLR